jgi:two-component system, LuxR family, sensor kinase FixL
MRGEMVQRELSLIFLALLAWMVACTTTIALGEPVGNDPEYLLRRWETDQGLPENSATAIVQTRQGYLWIGTFGGLVRFDGIRFTVLDTSNTPELPSDGIVNLHLDRADRLWVSTLAGMAVLEGHRWRRFGEADGWVGDFARTFVERADGGLLITTFDGHVLEYHGGRFSELPSPPGERGQGYFGFVDEDGRWCVVQHAFIGHWDGRNWQQTMAPVEVAAAEIATAAARGGGQWMLLGRELHRYRAGERQVRRTVEGVSGSIWSMYEDSAGNLWICSYDSGLYRVDPDGSVQHWTTENGLTYNGVRCVFEDRERNLWVGTSGGGLMQFAIRRARRLDESDGLTGRVVNSVSPDRDGNLWIATYDKGLFRWDGDAVNPVPLLDSDNRATLAQSVLADSAGRVWVGTYGEGLWRIEDGTASRLVDNVVGDGNILALFEDSRGRIWFGGGHKIAKFEAGQFRVYGPKQGLAAGGATCFAEDRSGTIWLANRSKVFRLGEGELTELLDDRGESIQGVLCLHADGVDGMWLGLARGGMLHWRDGTITRIDVTDGLAVDSVHGIVQDRGRALWLATNRGVVRYGMSDLNAAANGQTGLERQVLNSTDGFPSDQCPSGRQPICGQDARGQLWFATHKGVATIDPASFRVNRVPPPAAVEELVYYVPTRSPTERSVRRAQEGVARQRPPFAKRLLLPPGSRRIEIHFTGLSLTSPAKVRFQVKLEGLDTYWQAVGSSRIATYHELSPGDYVFQVRAANNDGIWGSEAAQLAFTVLPFYWQTLWFRSGGALLLVAVSSGAAWCMAHARQESLRKADEDFRLVVEAAPNTMIVVDGQGRMVLVNSQAETVFRYGRHELIGQPAEMLVPERFRRGHLGYRGDYLADPSARAMGAGRDLFARRKDGSEVPVEIRLTPFRSSRGMLILASIVDITERREREIELARERSALAHVSRVTMLGELSGSLAHELNQPLTAILSNAQAAQRFMATPKPNLDEVREILAEIVQDNNRAGEVIRRLRALFRKDQVAFEPLDVAALITEVTKLVHSDAVLRHVNVVLELDPDLPPILGDKVQLQQVVLNLLLNAFDALHHSATADRRVLVEARGGAEEFVTVRVQDNGPGLSGDLLERVFEPFFTTKSAGMGMGLSISRSIIEAHGGMIRAENNPQGSAMFWLTLPIDDKRARGKGHG